MSTFWVVQCIEGVSQHWMHIMIHLVGAIIRVGGRGCCDSCEGIAGVY